MNFIKEFAKFDKEPNSIDEKRVIVRTNSYGSSFGFFQRLFDEVKKDFPHITPDNADIKHYAGRHYKGTYGIEFNVFGALPESYKEVSSMEYTL